MIEEVPPEGNKYLYFLWKQVKLPGGRRIDQHTPIDQLHEFLIRLSELWSNYCAFYSNPDIPRTNNATEQVIGRMNMRARAVRGYKSWAGMHTGLTLAGTQSV